MSTTTKRGIAGRAARFAGAGIFVTTIWFAGLAIATLVAEPTRNVVVFGPVASTLHALVAGDAQMVDGGNGYMIVRGQHAGFVRALYAGGAWLVLPVTSGGCRGRREFARAL
jgi:hypothetical protein